MSLTRFPKDMVLCAMNAYINGDSETQNQASQYLQEYQDSTEAWKLSSHFIASMQELPENMACLAAVTLRHKLRTYWDQLSPDEHYYLFGYFVYFLMGAHNSGLRKLMEGLGAAIAVLVLRMRHDFASLCATVTPTANLAVDAPAAYLEVLQMLPIEAKLLNEEGRLQFETPNLLCQLATMHARMDLDTTYFLRRCMHICCIWMRAHVIDVDQLFAHPVVGHAFQVLKDARLRDGEFYEDASELLCAFLDHVLYAHQHNILSAELEAHIYTVCCSVPLPTPSNLDTMVAAAYFFMKVTKVFAGLNPGQPLNMLLERGPYCYEMLYKLTNYCDLRTISASMSNWIHLFEYLPHCFDYSTHQLFEPLIGRIVNVFYDKCRYSEVRPKYNSIEYEDKAQFRMQLDELLAKLSNMGHIVPMDTFLTKLISTAVDNKSSWMDVEASLFFVRGLVNPVSGKFLDNVRQMVFSLPGFLNLHAHHPAVSQQIIRLCAECHKCSDQTVLRHLYIEQLIEIGLGIYSDQIELSNDDKRDILEVIIDTCQQLGQCHLYDMSTYKFQFLALQELAFNHPREIPLPSLSLSVKPEAPSNNLIFHQFD